MYENKFYPNQKQHETTGLNYGKYHIPQQNWRQPEWNNHQMPQQNWRQPEWNNHQMPQQNWRQPEWNNNHIPQQNSGQSEWNNYQMPQHNWRQPEWNNNHIPQQNSGQSEWNNYQMSQQNWKQPGWNNHQLTQQNWAQSEWNNHQMPQQHWRQTEWNNNQMPQHNWGQKNLNNHYMPQQHAVQANWNTPEMIYENWNLALMEEDNWNEDESLVRSDTQLKDIGTQPYVVDIERVTKRNHTFRTALWTGEYLQLTVMSIPVGEDIGLEIHTDHDQFIRIEDGQGLVQMGDSRENLDFEQKAFADYAIFVPAGKWHNLTNTGSVPLKVYSIYAPSEHPFGTVHETKQIAMEVEKHD